MTLMRCLPPSPNSPNSPSSATWTARAHHVAAAAFTRRFDAEAAFVGRGIYRAAGDASRAARAADTTEQQP
ncbi:hypothetical protein [Yinghuangia sp. YIM S09857]|uniref:hypothetical protein n=1 Tax=Yinghuangia sp. YIM S09857 TaxID=3436929 RepID=UPI003F52962B